MSLAFPCRIPWDKGEPKAFASRGKMRSARVRLNLLIFPPATRLTKSAVEPIHNFCALSYNPLMNQNSDSARCPCCNQHMVRDDTGVTILRNIIHVGCPVWGRWSVTVHSEGMRCTTRTGKRICSGYRSTSRPLSQPHSLSAQPAYGTIEVSLDIVVIRAIIKPDANGSAVLAKRA